MLIAKKNLFVYFEIASYLHSQDLLSLETSIRSSFYRKNNICLIAYTRVTGSQKRKVGQVSTCPPHLFVFHNIN
jgi:hypothetical protein